MEVGSIVISKAGRDKGTVQIVVEIVNERFVKVVDGDLRPLSKAKLKNIKHIKDTEQIAKGLQEKIVENKQIFDKEIAKFIKMYSNKLD